MLILFLSPISSHSSLACETEHYFLLTCDQLELLWMHHFTKEIWVHGPPGCGKTIAAMEMMRILRQRGCRKEELLYVAENQLLCAYVRYRTRDKHGSLVKTICQTHLITNFDFYLILKERFYQSNSNVVSNCLIDLTSPLPFLSHTPD